MSVNVDAIYKDMVLDCIKTDSSFPFGNKSAAHASFIFGEMLKDAKKSVRILSGSTSELFLNDTNEFASVRSELKQCAIRLKETGLIKIVTVNEGRKDSFEAFVAEINRECGTETVVYLPVNYSGADDDIRHFIVTDSKRYRHELPHKKLDCVTCESEVRSEVCMNDPVEAVALELFFDHVWKLATTGSKKG